MPRRKKTHRLVALPVTTGPPEVTRATIQTFKPLPDDHPCYALVGLIAAEAARIEHHLDQSISHLAGLDMAMGACLTGQMIGPTPRLNAMIQLARQRGLSPEIIKEIGTVEGHLSGLFERRNRAVHDPWWQEQGSGEPHQFRGKARKTQDYGLTPKAANELEDDLTELRKGRDEVLALVSKIWTALRQP
jgi:hypothetical protein